MEKIKFGIQLIILMLAFPVFFITEMKQADKERKKYQPEQQELINAQTAKSTEADQNHWFFKAYMLPGLKLM